MPTQTLNKPAPRTYKNAKKFGFCTTTLCLLFAAILLMCMTPSRAAENRFESTIKKFEKQDKTRPLTKNLVLFTGSSSIKLWQTLEEDFAGYNVLNRGFGGSEFSDLLYFFDRIITPYHPDVIVIYAGSHDLHRKNGGPGEVLNKLKTFQERVRSELPNTKIFYISMKPSIKKWKTIELDQEANRLIKAWATETPNVEFIDIWTPMVAESSPPPEKYFVADLNHLSREGYQLWASVIRTHLEKHVSSK
ncbi:hypothetical protein Ga0100231_004090 [Opitutaceae bacterium TAV4]|nr:hypothetical protein Ga0100231_004090 [Opitutaceae bacterium TAV4]RRK02216.1 hypothetical protein Ga0100230_003270 [Opitutaceae bacterium TAV3]